MRAGLIFLGYTVVWNLEIVNGRWEYVRRVVAVWQPVNIG